MNPEIKNILLVEDDARLASLMKTYLEGCGFHVLLEERGDRAEKRIVGEQPDMVILDLMLPGKDGLSVLASARSRYQGPVLILTAKEDDAAHVKGLEIGADDYVNKPVEPRVLVARINALFRRSGRTEMGGAGKDIGVRRLCFGGLKIDLASRNVTLFDLPVTLSTIEFDILACFAAAPGRILDREMLYQTVKGIEYDGLDRSMDVAISRLRKKLEDHPEKPFRIKTIWGRGYLFDPRAWETPESC